MKATCVLACLRIRLLSEMLIIMLIEIRETGLKSLFLSESVLSHTCTVYLALYLIDAPVSVPTLAKKKPNPTCFVVIFNHISEFLTS